MAGGVPVAEDYDVVRSDFNDIAALGSEPKWNHNNCYFPWLLKQVPSAAVDCLDIGCGKGELSLLLAQKARKVTAVDLADGMIAYARGHNAAKNIEYICGNVLEMDFTPSSLDIIISTATAHHLPFGWLLEFAREKLRPGGKLLLLDLARASSVTDFIVWGFAALSNILLNLLKNGARRTHTPHAAEAWKKHGEHDHYMTMREIRAFASETLPGIVVRRKLFWRYALIWTKEPSYY
jgi:2-polyprenyl-3-methyl-5-hydroxy-6-metoxy-1,4-benzoquinol methylase